jgi:hypothetical protein
MFSLVAFRHCDATTILATRVTSQDKMLMKGLGCRKVRTGFPFPQKHFACSRMNCPQLGKSPITKLIVSIFYAC